MGARGPSLVLAALVAVSPAAALAEADDSMERVAAHDDRARELFEAGDHEGALAELAAAQVLAPATPRLYNMARCADELDLRDRALELYERYAGAEDAAPDRQALAEARLSALREEAEAEAVAPMPVGGSEARGAAPAPVAPRPRLGPGPFYATAAVAVAASVAAVVLGGLAVAAADEFDGLTQGDPRVDELRREGRALTISTDVTLGLAVASAAAALVLLFFTDFGGDVPLVASTPGLAGGSGLLFGGRL